MKTVTIEADAALDTLQKLEIFHRGLKAIAVSLERHGLQPGDITQLGNLRRCMTYTDARQAPMAGVLNRAAESMQQIAREQQAEDGAKDDN